MERESLECEPHAVDARPEEEERGQEAATLRREEGCDLGQKCEEGVQQCRSELDAHNEHLVEERSERAHEAELAQKLHPQHHGPTPSGVVGGAAHEDPEVDEPAAGSPRSGAPGSRLEPLQVQLIRRMKRGARRFDPAQEPNAEFMFRHLMQSVEVDSLLHTHSGVSEKFLHGPERGEKVVDLTWKLWRGEVSADSIRPLVAIRFVGDLWVVFGNRRLRALKEFRRWLSCPQVWVRCIVHDCDGEQPVHHALVAKLLDAATTANGGLSARLRERGRRW